MSPVITSASPIQRAATVHPSLLAWPATFHPPLVCGVDTCSPDDLYHWFGYAMPPLLTREFDGSFYSIRSAVLRLSSSLRHSMTLATSQCSYMTCAAIPVRTTHSAPLTRDHPFGQWFLVSLTDYILINVPSASAPTLATAGRTRRSSGNSGLDGMVSCDATFDTGLSASP